MKCMNKINPLQNSKVKARSISLFANGISNILLLLSFEPLEIDRITVLRRYERLIYKVNMMGLKGMGSLSALS